MHPWITRNFETVIPRNHFEQNMYLNDIDDKFRKALNAVFFLSMIKNSKIQKDKAKLKEKKKIEDAKKYKPSLSPNMHFERILNESVKKTHIYLQNKSQS